MSHSKPPHQALWGKAKRGIFFIFLNFFTFTRRTKKITFFFVKNKRKTCRKNDIFHFLEKRFHFPNLCFLHCILTRESEKKVGKKWGKSGKKGKIFDFFTISRVRILGQKNQKK